VSLRAAGEGGRRQAETGKGEQRRRLRAEAGSVVSLRAAGEGGRRQAETGKAGQRRRLRA
jgi:hypothetical protein